MPSCDEDIVRVVIFCPVLADFGVSWTKQESSTPPSAPPLYVLILSIKRILKHDNKIRDTGRNVIHFRPHDETKARLSVVRPRISALLPYTYRELQQFDVRYSSSQWPKRYYGVYNSTVCVLIIDQNVLALGDRTFR